MNADDMHDAGDVTFGQVPEGTQIAELVKYFREGRYAGTGIALRQGALTSVSTSYKTIDLSTITTVGSDKDAIIYLMLWPSAARDLTVQYCDNSNLVTTQTIESSKFDISNAVVPWVVSWRVNTDNFANGVAPEVKGTSTNLAYLKWVAIAFNVYTGKD